MGFAPTDPRDANHSADHSAALFCAWLQARGRRPQLSSSPPVFTRFGSRAAVINAGSLVRRILTSAVHAVLIMNLNHDKPGGHAIRSSSSSEPPQPPHRTLQASCR